MLLPLAVDTSFIDTGFLIITVDMASYVGTVMGYVLGLMCLVWSVKLCIRIVRDAVHVRHDDPHGFSSDD